MIHHNRSISVFSSLILTVVFSPFVSAATILEYQTVGVNSDAATSLHRIVIQNNRAAVYKDANSNKIDLIYDLETNSFQFLNHHERYYTRTSEKWLKQASDKRDNMKKSIEKKFKENQKKMTPEQRLAFQQSRMGMQMMPSMMSNFNSSLKKTYIGGFVFKKISNIRCRVVGIRRGNIYLYDLCLADREASGVNKNDFKVINSMLISATKMEGQGLNQYGFKFPRFLNSGGRYTGVPISITSPKGKPPKTLLTSISEQQLDDELHAPESYIRSEIPMPGF